MTQDQPGQEPPSPRLDTSVAHPARIYDYWLGGKDNFQADREAAQVEPGCQPAGATCPPTPESAANPDGTRRTPAP